MSRRTDFADVQLVGAHLHRLQDGKQRVAVLLDLGPLMAVSRVLDGQVRQVEFLLHLLELGRRRVLQPDPDEATGTLQIVADRLLRDVGELLAFLIGDAVDQH